MHTIGKILKTIREERGLQLRQVAIESNIDLTLLSRVKNGKRMPSESLLIKLAETYGLDSNLLVLQLVSDKILEISEQYPDHTIEALKVAQEKARLGERYISFFMNSFISRPIGLESRRYIGNKTKLTDWIMETIWRECPDAHSFCDIFAGTGAVAGKAIPYYDQVIFNDLLCANRVIYQGFFEKGEWNRDKLCTILDEYNHTDCNSLEDNYFSINFGGKYFDYGVSKLIGYVRQNIEDRRGELTDKEYNILLSTLIYNMDRIANTVGHFDAYIQGKEIEKKSLTLRLIDARSYDNVAIYQENSNTLARTLHADIVYMDPPYNSGPLGKTGGKRSSRKIQPKRQEKRLLYHEGGRCFRRPRRQSTHEIHCTVIQQYGKKREWAIQCKNGRYRHHAYTRSQRSSTSFFP